MTTLEHEPASPPAGEGARTINGDPAAAPGTPHPDPFLAGRGWAKNHNGIYARQGQREHEPEAGG